MSSFLRLDAERLYLSPLQESDAESMFEYHSNPEVVRYIPWPVRDLELVRAVLASYMTLTKFEVEGDYLILGMYRKNDNQLLGQVNAMFRSEVNQLAEFGYVLNPRFTGNGYATEAVRLLLSALFETGKVHRIIAKMDARNYLSAALCERVGLRREAHHLQDDWFKEEWTDTFIYAILRSEWNRNGVAS